MSMSDQTSGCDDGGNGVLDIFTNKTESYASTYNDGTGYRFAVNGDGSLSARDMTKNLGMIAENEEIVFFLVSNGNYDQIFFNKTVFNPDTYTSTSCTSSNVFTKTYRLGQSKPSGSCRLDGGWLNAAAVTRLSNEFGITFSSSDTYSMEITRNSKFSHLVIGAPANDPTQWILGWEDLYSGGDTDHNDIVFKIQRKTEGRAVSNVLSGTLYAGGAHTSYITAVNIEARDLVKNCVSGVIPSVNTTFDANNFSIIEWPDCPNSPGQVCPVRCETTDQATGSLALTNLSFSGDINEDFTRVNLSADGLANIHLQFSACQRPDLPTNPTPTFPYTFNPASPCRSGFSLNTFETPISVTISAQDLAVNSSGGFSGNFLVSADIYAENDANDDCFEIWHGTLNKTITLSGTLNGDWNSRKNNINYQISVDNGTTWTEVSHWDRIQSNVDGTRTKEVRIDLLSLGLVGDQLKWKGIFQNNDDQCIRPQLHEFEISYEASGNNSFSRASPVVMGNVLFSGSLETPALSWTDKTRLRGHLKAYPDL